MHGSNWVVHFFYSDMNSVLLNSVNYAIVDIETTGGSPKSSRITEIAIYKHDGEKIIDEFVTLVNPETQIPPFIVRLTGISDEMVRDAPRFFEIAKEIIEFTEGCVFVAHNVGFDYGILRAEYRSLGFDYRRPHLCTVRSSRYVIPGMDSYSLGNLTKSLGIKLVGRHRAGGDAYATAQLFSLLIEKDKTNLKTFIQEELNPKNLHPNLDLNELDEIPNKIGVYKFFNEDNQLIYIGKSIHIRKRIDQHLRNIKTAKGIQMQREITRIEFELTGSELIALLLESQLIKQHQPIYNRSLRRAQFPYGLFNYEDEGGYMRFHIGLVSKNKGLPLTSFTTRKEASVYLERLVDEHSLCQKLCDLYKTNAACFHFSVKKCNGACIGEESAEAYNERCLPLIDELNLKGASFYIVDKGRNRGESSLILVEDGSLSGMGYAPFHFRKLPVKKWSRFIDIIRDDRDARTILKLFLRKNLSHEVIMIKG